jgi:hypothetical protein
MAAAVSWAVLEFPGATGWAEVPRAAFLAALVAGGMAVYAALALIGGAITPGEIKTAFARPRSAPVPAPGARPEAGGSDRP